MLTRRIIPDYDPQSVLTKVDFQEDSCWEWQGHIDNYGYGTYGKQNHMAHRIVYEILVDKLKPEETIDHLCFNRSCVNPDHLETVPIAVNSLRGNGYRAINARKSHCVQGHEFTPDNTYRRTDRSTRECKQCRHFAYVKYIEKEGYKRGS